MVHRISDRSDHLWRWPDSRTNSSCIYLIALNDFRRHFHDIAIHKYTRFIARKQSEINTQCQHRFHSVISVMSSGHSLCSLTVHRCTQWTDDLEFWLILWFISDSKTISKCNQNVAGTFPFHRLLNATFTVETTLGFESKCKFLSISQDSKHCDLWTHWFTESDSVLSMEWNYGIGGSLRFML